MKFIMLLILIFAFFLNPLLTGVVWSLVLSYVGRNNHIKLKKVSRYFLILALCCVLIASLIGFNNSGYFFSSTLIGHINFILLNNIYDSKLWLYGAVFMFITAIGTSILSNKERRWDAT